MRWFSITRPFPKVCLLGIGVSWCWPPTIIFVLGSFVVFVGPHKEA